MKLNLNQIEIIKIWLINSLETISDAEPNLLADYIIALIEKEINNNNNNNNNLINSKNLCESLNDFLGINTSIFVNKLIEFIEINNFNSNFNLNSNSNKINLTSSHDQTYQVVELKQIQLKSIPIELCKDYHYKGFCARGDWCSFTHDETPTSSSFQKLNKQNQPIPSSTDLNLNSNRLLPLFPPPSVSVFPPTSRASVVNPNTLDSKNYSSNTLIVENVPPEALVNSVIYAFFEAFGRITNVIVDPSRRKVLVTFNSSEAARLAISSPAAIFGNRFVKIYRQKSGIAREIFPSFPSSSSSSSFSSSPVSSLPSILSSESIASDPQPTLSFTSAALEPHHTTTSVISSSSSRSAPSRVTSTLKNFVSNVGVGSDRANQLQANAQQQKQLLEQLEKAPALNSNERRSVLVKLRKLAEEVKQIQLSHVVTVDLRSQLLLLQNEAVSLGIDTSLSNHSRRTGPDEGTGEAYSGERATRRGTQGRTDMESQVYHPYLATKKRVISKRPYRLDNRTTKLLVGSLISVDLLEKLRTYFESFGIIRSFSPSLTSGDYIVDYISQSSAEEALSCGTSIEGVGEINLSWWDQSSTVRVGKPGLQDTLNY